jgi:hypothetical protein
MHALEIIWEIFFLLFFLSFQILLCEASGRCFRTSGRCSCMSERLFWLYGRYGLFVRTFILLVSTSVLLRFLRGTSSGRLFMFRPNGEPCRVKSHSPRATAHFFAFFGSFFSSCALSLFFLCVTL